jgi:dihydrofolate reductase
VLAQQGWHPHHAAVIDRAAPSADDGAMATIFYTAATLDGFIADEHDSLEWLMRQDIDMEDESAYPHFIAGVGALITGSTTYEWVLREAGTWAYEQATWVLSHRELPTREGVLVRAADSESDLLAIHDEAVAAAAGKDVWCVGGGGVAAALAAVGARPAARADRPGPAGIGQAALRRRPRPPPGRRRPQPQLRLHRLRRRQVIPVPASCG